MTGPAELVERLACKEATPNGGWYWFTDAEIVLIRSALAALQLQGEKT